MNSINDFSSGFIDIATYSDIDKYMYGKNENICYFTRETKSSQWFTQIPLQLRDYTGKKGFGKTCTFKVSNSGDYLSYVWLKISLPEIKNLESEVTYNEDGSISNFTRWTKNIGHNLIEKCDIMVNDIVLSSLDSYFLDFWNAFTIPPGKKQGYDIMIGNIEKLGNQTILSDIPKFNITLPLPFFFSRDPSLSLPLASIPYSEVKIRVKFRELSDLLVDCSGFSFSSNKNGSSYNYKIGDLNKVEMWGNYILVPNSKRKKMASLSRNMLIEQIQTLKSQEWNSKIKFNSYRIPFNNPVKALFFSVRNKTVYNEWSNYSSKQYEIFKLTSSYPFYIGKLISNNKYAIDPIRKVTLLYNNVKRLSNMNSEYFSLLNPYFHSPNIPTENGYHCYSYSLDIGKIDVLGSTNFSKLLNVKLITEHDPTDVDSYDENGKYEMIINCVNHNIICVKNGILGFSLE